MFQYFHIKAPPSSTMPTVTKLIQDVFNNKRISGKYMKQILQNSNTKYDNRIECVKHRILNLIYNQNREFIFEIQMVGCFQTLQVDHS